MIGDILSSPPLTLALALLWIAPVITGYLWGGRTGRRGLAVTLAVFLGWLGVGIFAITRAFARNTKTGN